MIVSVVRGGPSRIDLDHNARMKRSATAFILLLAAFGCTHLAPPPAEATGESILHYVRSNRDGSEPENIVVFRPSLREVFVYKYVERCTNAAYVTAMMDAGVREALHLTGGRVGRSGEQVPFGVLEFDEGSGELSARIDLPDAKMSDSITISDRPVHLYDFDLASLNAALQHTRPGAHFSFGLPVIWMPDAPKMFRNLGRVDAHFIRNEEHLGRRTRRYALALTGGAASDEGLLWLDEAMGFIVDVELGTPNHAEYHDFRLRLDHVQTGGREAWDALTRAHYADCPPLAGR